MIEAILPSYVVAAEAREDDLNAHLFPEERALIEQAVDRRRREFTTGRTCARRALGRLGRPPVPIPAGPAGQPLWPEGVLGSITHCAGYRAAVLGTTSAVAAIGIDAEPHEALPEGVLDVIALPEERSLVRGLLRDHPGARWDRLLFCAKESVYKAWFPLTGRRLGFEDARIAVAPATGTFTARFLVAGPPLNGRGLPGFSGRWLVRDGLILTSVVVPAATAPRPA
ncbi:4'-phosphopantetheinyl transferase superfamily protein [Sphaerisporangium sp. TRM90804]|uniref:4'-phosphopantetheinyl transferase family protein n=1 Tax=Sphaerisporangium sp. TRM90804 TaxID=3031113 RepID=UPI0024469489|nr:4'-phosphopantetheinyl transferase superfamily protein [Sphaerisporangium sp. TRM90804]MDH2430751.1 4'-phosphopantetheinyl transferase superfamily protein [Sphaerisporangium sp. TRM90804]